MRRLGRALLDVVALFALLWTLYDESRYLVSVEHAQRSLPLVVALDGAMTVVLIGLALYELYHLSGASKPLEHYVETHPWVYCLSPVLIFALLWGVYRDAVHFHLAYIAGTPEVGLDDEVDEIAAAILALALLKIGYHVLMAVRLFLARRRRAPSA